MHRAIFSNTDLGEKQQLWNVNIKTHLQASVNTMIWPESPQETEEQEEKKKPNQKTEVELVLMLAWKKDLCVGFFFLSTFPTCAS